MRRIHRALAVAAIAVIGMASLAACKSDSELSSTTTTTTAAAPETSERTDMRNTRYCEIIPITRERTVYVAEIYNTLGFSDCPQAKWETITEESVNEEYGSQSANLNGPRYWMMDSIIAVVPKEPNKTYTFGGPDGLEMESRGVIETKMGEDTVGEEFYAPNQVQRQTVFVYEANQPVFELTDPDGNIYIMQSYAQIVDKTLAYEQLTELGAKLDLPKGWSFSTTILKGTYELSTESSDGVAYVINDNLYNSYQRRT